MTIRTLSMLWVAVLGVGCATSQRLDQFDGVARAYERAIRWSQFESAFALAREKGAPVPDVKPLQNIRVLSYDRLTGPTVNDDKTEVQQLVEIHYTDVNRMNERKATDLQTWRYSEKEQRWILQTPFPSLR